MASNYRNVPRDYYQHDNRRGGGSSRGSNRMRYQNNRKAGGGRGFMKGNHARVDGDGDFNMGGDEEHREGNRFAPYSKPGFSQARGGFRRGRGRTGGGGNNASRGGGNYSQRGGGARINHEVQRRDQTPAEHRFPDEKSWYKVLIPYGRRLEKSFILKSLSSCCPVPFVPVNYHLDGNAAIFFLEDHEAAVALKQLNQKLMTPAGQKMSIVVRPSSFPMGAIPYDSIEEVKSCIGRRYDPSVGVLDLSCFHQDAGLKADGHFLPLYRLRVAHSAVETMEANVHNLVVLNLNGNKMKSLESFAPYISSRQTLKTLLLADNMLSKVSDLQRLNDLPIEELALKNNPLMKMFHNQTDLVECLRKIFPKLLRLDGEILPPLISFDLEGTATVPESQGSFFVNVVARDVTIQFLKQYFTMYDSDNRKGLIDAYHESAMFTVAAHKPHWGTALFEYNRCGRNLLRVAEHERRTRYLFRGKLDIVAFLQRLPRTDHDASSFVIDVCIGAQSIVTITSTGIFREVVANNGGDLRAFSRTFVLIPYGTGFNIVNDILIVTNATPEQTLKAFTTPVPAPLPSPVRPAEPVSTDAAIAITTSALSATSLTSDQNGVQQQMVVAFSQQSGMTGDWSTRCLEDNNWDFDKAAESFRQLHSKGSIPREAFLQ